ncbi:PHB depolymerase family esterase (plasmid) [Rhizobium sp. Pop5]|uniref:extracellular catalytic domain type 1 short-chain-length polyhydroxyalkanoate depolymerase n=1 Tax=Rhizobium sp. Pop5 TaxID=1223565 RepID=UPI000283C440|nr:PHB depolymerase family esterase [Rhizobium sp. Pop5]EJZ18466.1 polyhydroxybutyrate depolymerase [Rhizobium sp. Pop5]UVD60320.1 PHB depolymerase family esterase [Rhizobium sp. Pop5]
MKLGLARALSRAFKSQKRLAKLVEKVINPKARRPKRSKTRPVAERPQLAEISTFGSNPGRLLMKTFVPSRRLPKNPALVVVLHGCRQTPESLDSASSFSKLASDRGFVLLYPEQRNANNGHRCFSWFRPSAVARDRGEVLSIRQMIDEACRRHRIDRSRIFIAGLSAGGAMTAALVANYPMLFAGAAMIAGMPFGSSRDAMSALRAMKSGAREPAGGWGRPVAEISGDTTSWPRITVWHGDKDRTVNPLNAHACVDQWLEVLRIARDGGKEERKAWGRLQTWKAPQGKSVSLYSVQDLGHGLPVRKGPLAETSDPYVIPSDISLPLELMRLWGLGKVF